MVSSRRSFNSCPQKHHLKFNRYIWSLTSMMGKFLIALVALTGECTTLGFAGPASAKKLPYYRERGASALKPRQNAGTAIVNAASFLEGISPGGLATIFGE